MFEKLRTSKSRFEHINQELGDPAIISNRERYKALSRERAELKPLVEAYNAFEAVHQELTDNTALLETETDPELKALAAEEIAILEKKQQQLEEELKVLLLPKDPNDEKNILLEIRAGTGGEEAALFAAELYRMYMHFAERKNWKTEVLEHNATGLGGMKEIICLISGERIYSCLKYESGVHRVQRVPQTESSGRIHTSTVTVAVLPEAEDVDISIDDKDLRIDVYRASGPGGQGVNRTDSAVRLTHLPSGLVVACQDERSQHKNKARAMKILKSRLLDLELKKQHSERSAERRSQVGTGERSEKIRTYNFPQNRLTDHRIGLTIHNLIAVMEGDLDDLLSSLHAHYQSEALKRGEET